MDHLILPKGGGKNDHLKFQAVALQVVTKKFGHHKESDKLIPASEKGKSIKDEI